MRRTSYGLIDHEQVRDDAETLQEQEEEKEGPIEKF